MKGGDIVQALERFFLDIIGHVLPGVAFLLILSFAFQQRLFFDILPFPSMVDQRWVLLITAGFVLGQGLVPVGYWYRARLARIVKALRSVPLMGKRLPADIRTERDLMAHIAGSNEFRSFVAKAKEVFPWTANMATDASSVHAWRSVAMTVATEQDQIIYRFMFISLLSLGIAMGLLVLPIAGIIGAVARWEQLSLNLPDSHVTIGTAVGGLLVSLVFLVRSYEFYARAMRVPFSMALPKLSATGSLASSSSIPSTSTRRPRAYLAGGFRSGWQDTVQAALPHLRFADPREHGLIDDLSYTLWDLQAIASSDWVFAHLERDNPGGYALALEIGYAKALGKRILLVDEKSRTDETAARFLGMVRACADVNFDDLPKAIEFMKHIEAAYDGTRSSPGDPTLR